MVVYRQLTVYACRREEVMRHLPYLEMGGMQEFIDSTL